ncbi:MAG: NAD(P)/FAD-dependent oxidoreductase [Hyphomicrobiaceae bacterium]
MSEPAPAETAPEAARGTAGAKAVVVVGAGPAGLMAAEILAGQGHRVAVYDRMPSPARKLLMAGRGGLNLTHSEPLERFLERYEPVAPALRRAVEAFPPAKLVAWAEGLGCPTFVGSSGRIFPKTMKASPLLRAWLQRLSGLGVTLHLGHRLTGIGRGPHSGPDATFQTTDGSTRVIAADALVLALGGASWPRLGSDGAWTGFVEGMGVPVTPLASANAGLAVAWSDHVRSRFSGTPLKRVALTIEGTAERFTGDLVLTRTGLEGGPAYAAARAVRHALARGGSATAALDLRPDVETGQLAAALTKRRPKQSAATHLARAARLSPAAIDLLREPATASGPLAASDEMVVPLPTEAVELARRIKALPLRIDGLAGLERAISTAGGLAFEGLDGNFMLRGAPGVFAAGEMLDWEGPTGGYLLQATFATAVAAAQGVGRWLADTQAGPSAAHDPVTRL